MSNLVIIEADTNDGDYVHAIHENVSDRDVGKLKTIWHVISNHNIEPNWCKGEICDPEEVADVVYEQILGPEYIHFMNNYVPYGEHGIHTIESITVYKYDSKEEL